MTVIYVFSAQFSARKRAEKATSIAKFIARRWRVECGWMKIVVRNQVDPDLDADATKRLVPTLGKWKIGPNALIRAVQVSSTGGLLVIESTLMNGSTRNLFPSDVTQPNDHKICKNVISETAMPSTCGKHLLGSLAPPLNAAVMVPRNVH